MKTFKGWMLFDGQGWPQSLMTGDRVRFAQIYVRKRDAEQASDAGYDVRHVEIILVPSKRARLDPAERPAPDPKS